MLRNRNSPPLKLHTSQQRHVPISTRNISSIPSPILGSTTPFNENMISTIISEHKQEPFDLKSAATDVTSPKYQLVQSSLNSERIHKSMAKPQRVSLIKELHTKQNASKDYGYI